MPKQYPRYSRERAIRSAAGTRSDYDTELLAITRLGFRPKTVGKCVCQAEVKAGPDLNQSAETPHTKVEIVDGVDHDDWPVKAAK